MRVFTKRSEGKRTVRKILWIAPLGFLVCSVAYPEEGAYTLSNSYFSLKGRNGGIEELKVDPKGKGNHSVLLAKRIYLGEVNPSELFHLMLNGGGKGEGYS